MSQLPNDFDHAGYGGPCPPEGDRSHHYRFTVYAPERLPQGAVSSDTSPRDLLRTIACCVGAEGSLTGTYAR